MMMSNPVYFTITQTQGTEITRLDFTNRDGLAEVKLKVQKVLRRHKQFLELKRSGITTHDTSTQSRFNIQIHTI